MYFKPDWKHRLSYAFSQWKAKDNWIIFGFVLLLTPVLVVLGESALGFADSMISKLSNDPIVKVITSDEEFDIQALKEEIRGNNPQMYDDLKQEYERRSSESPLNYSDWQNGNVSYDEALSYWKQLKKR